MAGIAAAAAAVERGWTVELFEARGQLGGRAGGFFEPRLARLLDISPHVVLGCCAELLRLLRQSGSLEMFARMERLHFFAPDGRRYDVVPSRWLPPPLHLLPGLLRLGFLTWKERWEIVRGLRKLARVQRPPASEQPSRPTTDGGIAGAARVADSLFNFPFPATPAEPQQPAEQQYSVQEPSIGEWLRDEGQSPRAIERFWAIFLESALGESIDRISLWAARKVFVEGFLASRDAGTMYLPRTGWRAVFARLAEWLQVHGVVLHLGRRVERLEGDAQGAREIVLADGGRRDVDYVILAVPWWRLPGLLCPALRQAIPSLPRLKELQAAPITAVHLCFDRPITTLPHAVLVGRTSQWFFAAGVCGPPARPGEESAGEAGEKNTVSAHYCQVVISAAHRLLGVPAAELIARVSGELAELWPAAAAARLLYARAITHRSAVFSPQPGGEENRLPQGTPVPNLALAGDWTATDWPATLESAVRSGRSAVAVWQV
jgi:protoporphyrinogen oxidase